MCLINATCKSIHFTIPIFIRDGFHRSQKGRDSGLDYVFWVEKFDNNCNINLHAFLHQGSRTVVFAHSSLDVMSCESSFKRSRVWACIAVMGGHVLYPNLLALLADNLGATRISDLRDFCCFFASEVTIRQLKKQLNILINFSVCNL